MENQENNKTENNYKLRFLDNLGNSYPDWEQKSFLELYFRCFSNKKSIQKNSFLKTGKYPIVSQEKNLINGYSDFEDENLITEPVIVFGDHTLNLKLIDFPFYKGADGIVLLKNKTNNENLTFLYQLLKLNLPHSQGYKRHFSVIKNKLLMIPSFAEQQKIGSFLSEIDYYIQLQKEEIDLTKEYKKSLLEQIFSQKIRFIDEYGNNYSDWKETILEDILTYLQPTKYLSTKSEIKPQGKIKVLTANKSFLLGFSNNEENIYKESLPVILFDDFTCDSKFVDFNFKVKSSALKILLPKENYIDHKFIYEAIKLIDFAPSIHKRHWISEYSKLVLLVPSLSEQQRIGILLTNLDQQINQLELEFKNLNEYKNILLNKLIF